MPPPNDRLIELAVPFENPGKLAARIYLPEGMTRGAPLVVVLHGCTQNAAAYDQGAGWSRLADRAAGQGRSFGLLFPEQQRSNNPNLCFNWFARQDTARGEAGRGGEAASIAAMIGAMASEHDLDPKRVFITGLSAGGAMSAAMLQAYPELFAAGAIIAGLAAGIAEGVPEALAAMAGGGGRPAKPSGASGKPMHLPRLSVWHGSADTTVVPANGDAIVARAIALRGIDAASGEAEAIGPHRRTTWRVGGQSGKLVPLVEQYEIAGMGHGVPLSAAGTAGADAFALGARGPHMIEAGIDSTARIAAFFGLVDLAALGSAAVPVATEDRAKIPHKPARAAPRHDRKVAAMPGAKVGGVQAVIEDALRKAGLM